MPSGREKAYTRDTGKTTTTEFAAVTKGSKTRNPHDPSRTPGGSSSGSGAAVGDLQVPIGLGTQTGGSTIRPGSFNGIYALKPTWNSITREGQKIYSLILDTLGLYARSVDDLQLLAQVFELKDDEPPPAQFTVRGAKFGFMKTASWEKAGPGTKAAMETAKELLVAHHAEVEDIELPDDLSDLLKWHETVLYTDGRPAFLPEYRVAKEELSDFLQGHVENVHKYSHAEQLKAFDCIAAARPRVDEILARYAAVITPSVPDEAPLGIEGTGSAVFNCIWTVSWALLHGSYKMQQTQSAKLHFSRPYTLRLSIYQASEVITECRLDCLWSLLGIEMKSCLPFVKASARSLKMKEDGSGSDSHQVPFDQRSIIQGYQRYVAVELFLRIVRDSRQLHLFLSPTTWWLNLISLFKYLMI